MEKNYNDKEIVCWAYNKITRKSYPVFAKNKDKYYQLIQKYNKKNNTKNYQPENYKDVYNYEEQYQVGVNGTIKSKYQNKELSQKTRKDTYKEVRLFKDRKGSSKLSHRVVAETYIGKHDGYNYVNHLDEDKTNNEINNLVLTTMKENNNYGTRNKRISETLKNTYAQRKYKNYYEKKEKKR